MKTFETGKTYFARSVCMHDCIFTIKVISRTAKTVTYIYNDVTRRSKIHANEYGEYIIPERYSMAPVFRAEHAVA